MRCLSSTLFGDHLCPLERLHVIFFPILNALTYPYPSFCPLILFSNPFYPRMHYLSLSEGSAPQETATHLHFFQPLLYLSMGFLTHLPSKLEKSFIWFFTISSVPSIYIPISWIKLSIFIAFKNVTLFFHPHLHTLPSLCKLEVRVLFIYTTTVQEQPNGRDS